LIASTANIPGIRVRDQMQMIKQAHPGVVLKDQDLWNARHRQYRQDLGGLTATGSLIKLLDEDRIDYEVSWNPHDPDRVLGLVWTPKSAQKLWKQFPTVLGFDNTYKTNYLGYPLFVGIGMTNLGTPFNTIFGLIDTEERQAFDFLAQSVASLCAKTRASIPRVIVTDRDMNQKATLAAVFPDAQQQSCIFHIMSNIKVHIRSDWVRAPTADIEDEDAHLTQAQRRAQCQTRKARDERDKKRRKEFTKAFESVLYAPTEPTFNAAWDTLRRRFSDQPKVINYIATKLMPSKDEWAQYRIKWYPNYGIKTTSPNESTNYNIKSYLISGRNNLFRLFSAIQTMCANRLTKYNQALAKERITRQTQYLGQEYLGHLPTEISAKGLALIAHEKRRAMKAVPGPGRRNATFAALGRCEGVCSIGTQYGLPCRHIIARKILTGESLTLADVDPYWHLSTQADRVVDPYARIKNPHPAPRGKGRPSEDDRQDDRQAQHQAPRRAVSRVSGVRSRRLPKARGRARLTPSIRRRRSNFEMVAEIEPAVEAVEDAVEEVVLAPVEEAVIRRTRSGRVVKMTSKGAALAKGQGRSI